MPLSADVNGEILGKFPIPAGVKAGTKAVDFVGAGGTKASANFVGQGVLETIVNQQQTTITTVLSPAPIRRMGGSGNDPDPLAQTFSLASSLQIGGVDLFVTAKGTTPIQVQIRETSVGFPTQVIFGEAQLVPAGINVNAWNRFTFNRPIPIQAGVEYALVVLCNDAVGSVAIAELGKFDANLQSWVTSQPYQVGVLLSSANASTWTAHQDRDMAFRLLAAQYTESVREIDLGEVAVTGATDLLVLAVTDQPSTGATSEIELTLPDTSTLLVSDGQVVQFAAAITGNIGVKARLRATANESAVLAPGMQLVAGTVALTADYVTRAFDADATGADITVIYDGDLPSGSAVAVYVSGIDGGDTYTLVPQDGLAKPLGDDVFEYKHKLDNVMEARVRVKLVLTGTIAARPFVSNLRVSVT